MSCRVDSSRFCSFFCFLFTRGKIVALTDLLRGVESVRLLALDSRESFQSNKYWYRRRMEQETNPALTPFPPFIELLPEKQE